MTKKLVGTITEISTAVVEKKVPTTRIEKVEIRFVELKINEETVRFVTREEAIRATCNDDRARNYELESDLCEASEASWVVSDWCPFDGRFCKLASYLPLPHPPMRGEPSKPPHTNVPWTTFDAWVTTRE